MELTVSNMYTGTRVHAFYCKSTPLKNLTVNSAIHWDDHPWSSLPASMILLTAKICKTILVLQFTDA